MLGYVIYEMQTDAEGETAHLPPINETDENEALAVFCEKKAAAIRSSVYMHTVMLCTTDGRIKDSTCQMHNVNGGAE